MERTTHNPESNSMTTSVREFFRNLPPEGIGVHGTTLANAQKILREGLKIETDNPQYGNWFCYFDPKKRIESPLRILDSMRNAILQTWFYADQRVRYRDSNSICALVVIKPSRDPFHHEDNYDEALVEAVSEVRKISKNDILGIIELPDKVSSSVWPSGKYGNSNYEDEITRRDLNDILIKIKNLVVSSQQRKSGRFQRLLARFVR